MATMPIAPPIALSVESPAALPSKPSFGEHLRQQSQPAPSSLDDGMNGVKAHVARTLESIDRSQHQLDDMIRAAKGGRTFSPAQLLALQAEAYRFSQGVDVASKIVEQGAQSIKQSVNTQV